MANVRRGWIKIRFSMDRFGGVQVHIVSRRLDARARRYLRSAGADPGEGEAICYLQPGEDLPEEISQAQARDLRGGWDVTVLMDPWIVGQGMLGYDAGDRAWWAPSPRR